jgi:SNF2 family DNA or RNA helicase
LKGLAWLKDREESNKGCILADDMGLGKTIQSIALILTQPSDKESHRPTLIVAPLALIRQWEAEIKTKVKPNVLKVQVYHGPQRKSVAHQLSQADVVITTYNGMLSIQN